MNHRLLTALRDGVTQGNREYISNLIQESCITDDPLIQELRDMELAKIVNIASSYVADAVQGINANGITIESLYGGSELTIGLRELMRNPAVLNYTHAVALVLGALLLDD